MATNQAPYHTMIRDVVEETMRLVNQYVDVFLDDIWPSLVEMQPGPQRHEFYKTIDWAALKDTSEQLWLRMSQDAMALEDAENRRMQSATEAYGQTIAQQVSAFRGEQMPFGAGAVAIGAPLPLGSAGI